MQLFFHSKCEQSFIHGCDVSSKGFYEMVQQFPLAEHHDPKILHPRRYHFTASAATAYEATFGEDDNKVMSNEVTAPGFSASSLFNCT